MSDNNLPLSIAFVAAFTIVTSVFLVCHTAREISKEWAPPPAVEVKP